MRLFADSVLPTLQHDHGLRHARSPSAPQQQGGDARGKRGHLRAGLTLGPPCIGRAHPGVGGGGDKGWRAR